MTARLLFWTILTILTVLSAVSCSPKRPDLGLRQSYNDALFAFYDGNASNSREPWEKIIAEHSGTRYAGYAYLLLADSYFAEGTTASLKTSEIYYKLFMDTNRNSHLVPYALSQVVILNYLLNESKLMVHHTDASPYKEAILNYQKFYFIYPNSVYLEMVQDILARSVEKLALIEENIGDWYYKQKLYSASVNRFRLILRDYPTYSGAPRVSEKLVKALKNNNQEQTAEEFIKAVEAVETKSGG